MKLRSTHAILTLAASLLTLAAAPVLRAEDAPAKPAAAQPRAVIDEAIFDAGKVTKGEEVAHDFVIRNDGTAPLEITEVRPACGCTVADYDDTVAPGASGKIHAVVDTTDFAGGISKGLTVLTNDPENPRLALTIKAEVEPSVYLRPGFARFIQAQHSDPGVVEEIIFTRDMPDLEVLDVQSPYPFLDAKARPATEDEQQEDGSGKQWVVTLTLNYDKAPVGPLADYVKVTTNHPKQKEVVIPISGFVRPMVVLTPARADFGDFKLSGDSQAGATILLKSYAFKPMQVTVDPESVPKGVDVDVTPVEDGRQYKVHIALGDELASGPLNATIRLKTDNPKEPVVEIPLTGNRV